MKRLSHIFSLLVLCLFVYISFRSLMPTAVSGIDAHAATFSTERALIQLKEISKEPHYVGTPAHAEVRAHIMQELRKMGLETQIQEGFTLDTWSGYSNLVKPQNILARMKGSGNGKAVLLLSHYDSAPHSASKGASDAGTGVVTILESMRAYLASGKKPINDIIICITDAEEVGLDGASLFVNEHPWAKNIGVALNFEARGSGGPSNMIVETNGGNSKLIKGFKEAGVAYPVATSLMYSIYKLLPNDTDSTILREDGDIDGFFFAFIDDHYDYHTVNDSFENVDKNSLEHQGSYLMPLLAYYAQADISNLKSDQDYVYFDMAVAKFVTYPFSWIWPMVIIAVLVFIFLLLYGFKKERLTGKGIAKGFGAFLTSLVLGGGLAYLLWELIKQIYPSYNEMLPVFIYNGHYYIMAFTLIGFSLCMGIYHKFTKDKDTVHILVAPLSIWLLINVLLAIYLKGAAFFIIPVYFGLLALWLLIRQRSPSKILLLLLCAPAIFLFAPLIQFFPVGLGPNMLLASVLFFILLFGLLLPIIGFFRNKKAVGILSLLVAVLFFAIAHTKSKPAPDRQAPNSLLYYHNADTQKAYWVTYNKMLDDWTKGYLGNNPEDATTYIGNAAGSKYNTPYTYAKETAVISLPQSEITLTQDTVLNGLQYATLVVQPKRAVNQIRMYTDQATPLRHIQWNGKTVTPDSTNGLYKKRWSRGILSYYLTQGDLLEFKYAVPERVDPVFTLKEFSYDLLTNPNFTVAARPNTMMPKPFVPNDAVVVERTIAVSELIQKQQALDSLKTVTIE